jgi:hypothetical protein
MLDPSRGYAISNLNLGITCNTNLVCGDFEYSKVCKINWTGNIDLNSQSWGRCHGHILNSLTQSLPKFCLTWNLMQQG